MNIPVSSDSRANVRTADDDTVYRLSSYVRTFRPASRLRQLCVIRLCARVVFVCVRVCERTGLRHQERVARARYCMLLYILVNVTRGPIKLAFTN